MLTSHTDAEARARRLRRLRRSLALPSATDRSCDPPPAGDAASPPECAPLVAVAITVHELYESLLAARRLAQRRAGRRRRAVTVFRQDVHELSSGPGLGGSPLSSAEADRVAAVLNEHRTHRPAQAGPGAVLNCAAATIDGGDATPELDVTDPPSGSPRASKATVSRERVLAVMTRAGYPATEIREAAGALPDQVDLRHDRAIVDRFALNLGELMDRMGSSP